MFCFTIHICSLGDDPVNSWYGEIKDFNSNWYNDEPPRGSFNKTGHFTQVIWKSSQYVGVGLVTIGNSCFVVANYDPPGNIISQYKQNVLPPKK